MAENALCQCEALARYIPFRPEMRVLDLGCGRATSSIFLAREFGVEVLAVDSATSPTENFHRAVAFGCESWVLPLRADAHNLPFAQEFFDAVIAIDSYLYYGTDERYLPYLAQFVKPGGYFGVTDVGFTREIRKIDEAPQYLRDDYPKHWSFVHTVPWWKNHWEKTGLVDVRFAGPMAESEALLQDYLAGRLPGRSEDAIMRATRQDDGRLISLFCLVARKR